MVFQFKILEGDSAGDCPNSLICCMAASAVNSRENRSHQQGGGQLNEGASGSFAGEIVNLLPNGVCKINIGNRY